jgi:hypothetical protein
VAFLGEPRVGKSYGGMQICSKVDPRFDVRTSLSFQPSAFINQIQNLPERAACEYDEPGATFAARDFMTKLNRMMGFVIQTFGSKLIVVVWCLPMLPLMDLTGRNLLNYSVWMRDRGYGWVYKHNVNVHTGKPYKHHVMTVKFKMPFEDRPEQLVEYERMKRDFQDKNYRAIEGSMRADEEEALTKYELLDPKAIAEKVAKAPDEFFNEKGDVDAGLICALLGVPYQKAWLAKKLLKQSGISQPPATPPGPSNGSSAQTQQSEDSDQGIERF